MSESIIDLVDWLQTPAGQYLLEWERARTEAAVVDIFGYHALQLGLPQLDALDTNRMPQALVLTAIVIGFATTALFLVLLLAARGLSDTDHVDGQESEQ